MTTKEWLTDCKALIVFAKEQGVTKLRVSEGSTSIDVDFLPRSETVVCTRCGKECTACEDCDVDVDDEETGYNKEEYGVFRK